MSRGAAQPVASLPAVGDDALQWLLGADTPAVRHVALRDLLDRSDDDPELAEARAAAMAADPIASILAAQHADGHWEKPGPGYATKYRGTVWQIIFLDQLGADPTDDRVRGHVRTCSTTLWPRAAASGRPASPVPRRPRRRRSSIA